jgi:hypothetical protein
MFPAIFTPIRVGKIRTVFWKAYLAVWIVWAAVMLVLAYPTDGYGYEALKYQLTERIDYDENTYVVRYLGAYGSLIDCIRERDKHQSSRFECLANMVRQDS